MGGDVLSKLAVLVRFERLNKKDRPCLSGPVLCVSKSDLVFNRLSIQPEVFMLEAVLDGSRCVEAPDVLVNHPEELPPVQGHPVVVFEALGDVVRVGGNQPVFIGLEQFSALGRVSVWFLIGCFGVPLIPRFKNFLAGQKIKDRPHRVCPYERFRIRPNGRLANLRRTAL